MLFILNNNKKNYLIFNKKKLHLFYNCLLKNTLFNFHRNEMNLVFKKNSMY